jgi:hypothetical protein
MMSDAPADSDRAERRIRRLVSRQGVRRPFVLARRWLPPSLRGRLRVAAAGYTVLVVFGTTLAVVRWLAPGWSWSGDLAAAGAIAAPLALALVYERLTALKTPWFEIALTAAETNVDVAFATALQDASPTGSANPEIAVAVSALLQRGAPKVVRINLRTEPYWWSTRVFLLAALTDDFTQVERLVFVEGSATQHYVGMAHPQAVRAALADRYPAYQRAYCTKRAKVGGPPDFQVSRIVGEWQMALWEDADKPSGPHPGLPALQEHEETLKEYITATELLQWPAGVLDTSRVEWDGWPQDPRLRATILGRDDDYIALVQGRRLDHVASRNALAVAVAQSALRIKTPEQARE